MTIATIIVLAVTVEALVEYGKLIVEGGWNLKQVIALVLGVALAVLADVDLFAVAGITFIVPFVGTVLTGIMFSRGSNYVADFIKLIQEVVTKKAIVTTGGDPDKDGE